MNQWYQVLYNPYKNQTSYMSPEGKLMKLELCCHQIVKGQDGKKGVDGKDGKDGKVTVEVRENGVVDIVDQDGNILISVENGNIIIKQ